MLPLALIPILLLLICGVWLQVNEKKRYEYQDENNYPFYRGPKPEPNQVPVPLGAEFMPFYLTVPINGKSRAKRCNRIRKAIKARFKRKRK